MGRVRASELEGMRFTTFLEIGRVCKAFLEGVCHARIVPDCVGGKKWLCPSSLCRPASHMQRNGVDIF